MVADFFLKAPSDDGGAGGREDGNDSTGSGSESGNTNPTNPGGGSDNGQNQD